MSVRSSGDRCRTPSTIPTFLCTISAALSFVTNHCWFSRYLSLAEVSYSPKEMHSELDLLLDLSCKKVFGLPLPFSAAQWGRDEIQLSSELSWTRLETFPAQLLPGTGQIGAFWQQRAQLCRWSQAFRVHVWAFRWDCCATCIALLCFVLPVGWQVAMVRSSSSLNCSSHLQQK